MKPPLFFLHVPRTGGTSLLTYLDRQFEPGRVCPAHEQFQFEALEAEGRLEGYDFYRGHFGVNLGRRLSRPGTWITLLRRPGPRVFSTWRHLRSLPAPFDDFKETESVRHIRNDSDRAHRYDFMDFCRAVADQGRRSFFNQATVLLGAGRGWGVERRGALASPATLAAAKAALETFAFVGLTEAYAESMIGLQQRLGLDPAEAPWVNSAPPADMPTDRRFLAWLDDWTAFDIDLYESVRREALVSG